MAAKGGVETNIEPGLVARLVRGAKYAVTGNLDWFGPGAPLNPSAPEVITGRSFDLPISVNTVNSTKLKGVSFRQLRQFADACDIVRLLIETRKDQVCGLSWVIKEKDASGSMSARKTSNAAPKPKSDPRIDELTEFFLSPDKDHHWSQWLRLVLEDMFVLDAPSLYVQRTNAGAIYALRPIDGSTIKRIIDTHGWTPMPPDPAYQQILKGMVALDYTRDELIYKPRNPRTNRIYGYGHVEQVIVTAKLLMSRQASNLEYYETGNLPEGWISAAEGWTPQQLMEYQTILDAQLSGNLAERRKARAVPHGSTWTAVKEPALKSDYDEWLARIACFAFSYPPTPFIRQMNRSTSDNAKESAEEEGVQPITRWVKELIDEIIQTRMGFPDLEFGFEDKEAQDPLERATIDKIYVDVGVLLKNEIRAEMGLDPLPEPVEGQPEMETTEQVAGQAPPAGTPGPQAKPAVGKLAKAAGDGTNRSKPPTPQQIAAETKLADELAAALDLSAEETAEAVGKAIEAGDSTESVLATLNQVALKGMVEVSASLDKAITTSALSGVKAGLLQLRIGANESITEQVNESAITWAQKRAASLITSNADGGELIDATRDLIRATVEQAVADGGSVQKLAKTLREHYAFSPERAKVIARTELAMAESSGNLQAYLASGVVQKKMWVLDPDPCPVCIANAAQGQIPLLQEFQGGVMTSPQHPNCRCAIAPVINFD